MHYFLFNDVLMRAQPSSGLWSSKLTLKSMNSLDSVTAVELRDVPQGLPTDQYYLWITGHNLQEGVVQWFAREINSLQLFRETIAAFSLETDLASWNQAFATSISDFVPLVQEQS